jgi:predicted MFS family arabinose efflux permease
VPGLRLFWLGQLLTLTGSEVSLLALPVVAASLLHCTGSQIGVLVALEFLPPVLLGLHIGALFDRYASKAILVGSDLARGVLLATIPVLYVAGRLEFVTLCVLTVLLNVLRTVFDSGYPVFIKRIVEVEQLAATNVSLGKARSFAEAAGPPLGGFLIAAAGAAQAVVADAASFFCSALLMSFVRERAPRRVASEANPLKDVLGGARIIARNPVLKLMIGVSATWNLFYAMMWTLYIAYLLRVLVLDTRIIGLTYISGGLGFFLGSALLSRLRKTLSLQTTATIGIWITVAWGLLTAMADGEMLIRATLVFLASFAFAFGQALYNISSLTIRQLATPEEYLGRVSALASVLFRSTMPIGALLAGMLSQMMTLRQVMLLGTAGLALSAFILTVSRSGQPDTISAST